MERRMVVFLVLLPMLSTAYCHQTSQSYLYIQSSINLVEGVLSIPVLELDLLLDFDQNNDSRISWREILAKKALIVSRLEAHFSVDTLAAQCQLIYKPLRMRKLTDKQFLSIAFDSDCQINRPPIKISYTLLADINSSHKLLIKARNQGVVQIGVITSAQPTFSLAATSPNSIGSFVSEGTKHILIGYDHLLFLICLLLPLLNRSIFRLYRHDVVPVIKTISAFTLSHSLTLALSILNIFTLAAAWVEFSIALSIVISACILLNKNNLDHWGLAYFFGLIHGFGFANVLQEWDIKGELLVSSLIGFNIGVEIGQIFILLLSFCILTCVVKMHCNIKLLKYTTVVFVLILGSFWTIDRGLMLIASA